MKKIFKWVGIILGGLIALLLVVGVGLIISANTRLNKTYSLQPDSINVPTDPVAIAQGAYIYTTACAGCHGDDLAGTEFFSDPALGSIPAPNLTSGTGGIGAAYSDQDWVRTIRHGITPEGKPVMIMPSTAFWHFSDADLVALVAYVKSAPPVDNDLGEKSIQPLGRLLIAAGMLGEVFAAENIDHNAARPAAPTQAVAAAYGQYLVDTRDCRGCHGADLAGAQPPEPGAPFSSNLTPGGTLAIWSAGDFIQTMRTGLTPYGRQLDASFMPYEEFGRLTDDDLTAIFLYLQSLLTVETDSR